MEQSDSPCKKNYAAKGNYRKWSLLMQTRKFFMSVNCFQILVPLWPPTHPHKNNTSPKYSFTWCESVIAKPSLNVRIVFHKDSKILSTDFEFISGSYLLDKICGYSYLVAYSLSRSISPDYDSWAHTFDSLMSHYNRYPPPHLSQCKLWVKK